MTTRKTTKATPTAAKKPAVEKAVEAKAPAVEKPVEEKAPEVAKPKKKVYKDTDLIDCRSITPGELLEIGEKTQELYDWLSEGDVVGVAYKDLVAAIKMKKPVVYMPRFVIEDDDFLADYPDIQELYDSMYSKDNLRDILKLQPTRMAEVIENLPEGAKDALKTVIVQDIENGSFDSVQRIRVIDQIFGTDMLLKLTT